MSRTTVVSSRTIGPHLLDGGPVLCLCGSDVMAERCGAHLASEGAVVVLLADEVCGWSSVPVVSGDRHRTSGVKRAAAGALARFGKTLLSPGIPTPAPEPAMISAIQQDFEDRVATELSGRTQCANGHAGEAHSVHESTDRSLRFVWNDGGARHVTGARSVAHESFADIARRLVSYRRDGRSTQALEEPQRLVRKDSEIGDAVGSVLDSRWASQ